ncbi:MAG: GDSL-type esterase/lipase family protein [Phycisphaerales bacterium]
MGDSNAAAEDGWVTQAQRLEPGWLFINRSVPGNTLGFDNLDNPRLNTLRNLDEYLARPDTPAGRPVDVVLIALGTNDCKAVFKVRGDEVRENLRTMIRRIRAFDFNQDTPPRIAVFGPPPVSPDERVAEKYHGAAERVRALAADFNHIATETGCLYLDAYAPLIDDYESLTSDGVHLTPRGHQTLAGVLTSGLSPHATPAGTTDESN